MDFVAFETFSEADALPSPQPALSLPLKSNIENLGSKLAHFNQFKSLLGHTPETATAAEEAPTKLAEKYASLSLRQLESPAADLAALPAPETENVRTSALSKRLARALNPPMSDSLTASVFSRLERHLDNLALMVDPGVGGSMARKNLRGEIEADLLKSQAAVLADYARPMRGLRSLGDQVAAMQQTVEETGQLLGSDDGDSARISAQVAALTRENQLLGVKKALLASFRRQFTLNEYEEYVLSANDINDDFFAALARAEAISERCLLLLALDNPQLGLQVMAKNNELIDRALGKITAFCKRTLSNMFLLGNRARVDSLHLCFRYLMKRPKQLDEVVDVFVESRSQALIQDFNLQAGEGDSGSSLPADARPVFYSQHDSAKYVADLLAYVHSVVVNETDTVNNVFENRAEFSSTIENIMPKILSALVKPVRAQIEKVISAETKLAMLYQIYSHLDLYLLMYKKLEHAGSICNVVRETIRLAQSKLVMTINNRLMTVKNSNQAQMDLSPDLQPPEWIVDFYSDVLPIIDAENGTTIFGLSQEEHNKFLDLIVNEPIGIFNEHLALAAKELTKRDVLIFRLNFLDLVLTKIMPLALLNDKVLEVNHSISDYSNDLQELQLQTLLRDCNLTDFYNIVGMICPMDDELFEPSIYQSITENKLFTSETVSSINTVIQQALPSALIDVQLSLMKLNSPMLVNEIITSSSLKFAKFYKLFSAIVVEFLGEPLLTWTTAEVATLLGVEVPETDV